MQKVNTISELENLLNSDNLIWFSKTFQCGFKIEYIDATTYSLDSIKCRFVGGQNATISLKDIYSI